jgi:fatty acid desaturase
VLCLLPGFVGTAGLALVGAVVIAFGLQGLALLHEVTRGRNGRVAMLSAAYVLVFFVGHTVLPLLAIAGLADTAFGLRNRFRSGAAGPGLPPT